MKNTTFLLGLAPLIIFTLVQCGNGNHASDAYGNFEVDEVSVSSEAQGIIQQLEVEEGGYILEGSIVGAIDSTQLTLKKAQLIAQLGALNAKMVSAEAQANIFREQIRVQEREYERLERLFGQSAATQKQLDDAEGVRSVLLKQLELALSQVASIASEKEVMRAQIKQADDQIERCKIRNPIDGTVLLQIMHQGEMVGIGKPIYRIASLEYLNLRVYISGAQLAQVSLGQKVRVLTDGANGEMREYEGIVSWISASAEFTPRTIQTRQERVNLVYPIKVCVKNDGHLSIGMPGEILFGMD